MLIKTLKNNYKCYIILLILKSHLYLIGFFILKKKMLKYNLKKKNELNEDFIFINITIMQQNKVKYYQKNNFN